MKKILILMTLMIFCSSFVSAELVYTQSQNNLDGNILSTSSGNYEAGRDMDSAQWVATGDYEIGTISVLMRKLCGGSCKFTSGRLELHLKNSTGNNPVGEPLAVSEYINFLDIDNNNAYQNFSFAPPFYQVTNGEDYTISIHTNHTGTVNSALVARFYRYGGGRLMKRVDGVWSQAYTPFSANFRWAMQVYNDSYLPPANTAPEIDFVLPVSQELQGYDGQVFEFDIEVDDAELDTISYDWRVDNVFVANTEDYSYEISGDIDDIINISVNVYDNNLDAPQNLTDSHHWLITVERETYQASYNEDDFVPIIVDGFGTAGATFVGFITLLVVLLILIWLVKQIKRK